MQSGRKKYFDNLIKFFPEEEAAIKKYEQLIVVSTSAVTHARFFVCVGIYIYIFVLTNGLGYTRYVGGRGGELGGGGVACVLLFVCKK